MNKPADIVEAEVRGIHMAADYVKFTDASYVNRDLFTAIAAALDNLANEYKKKYLDK